MLYGKLHKKVFCVVHRATLTSAGYGKAKQYLISLKLKVSLAYMPSGRLSILQSLFGTQQKIIWSEMALSVKKEKNMS